MCPHGPCVYYTHMHTYQWGLLYTFLWVLFLLHVTRCSSRLIHYRFGCPLYAVLPGLVCPELKWMLNLSVSCLSWLLWPLHEAFLFRTWPTVVEGIPFSLLPSLVGNCVPLRVVHDLCLEVLPVGPRGLRNNQYMIFHSAGPFWDPDLLLGQEAFPGNITEPPPATIWLLCSF